MDNITLQEQLAYKKLCSEIGQIGGVSYSYQDFLSIATKNLQSFYGDRADWSKCLERYFDSIEYKKLCHYPHCCDEIPILTKEQIQEIIREEEQYYHDVQKYRQVSDATKYPDYNQNPEPLFRAADMLGILPNQATEGLYHWIINRQGMSEAEKQAVKEKMVNDLNSLSTIIDVFSYLFGCGTLLTFSNQRTAMIQQKSKYYYRGENAYHGSSRPGLFRRNWKEKFAETRLFADCLTWHEACTFLNQFDAVRQWYPSGVYYTALAQHYGIKTPMMDLTSDFKTALFFACCKYQDGKWAPLSKNDFNNKNARPGVEDARYGVLYRTPTEITEMKWALAGEHEEFNLIVPIGYQPFMRCSSQHSYMIKINHVQYDMMQDPLFDKYKIELDEELCKWIFSEMDQGKLVYPHDDVYQMESYMKKIGKTKKISKKRFEEGANIYNFSEDRRKMEKRNLEKLGYIFVDGPIEYITYNKLRKINRNYSINVAFSKLDVSPLSAPLISVIPDQTWVRWRDDSEIPELLFNPPSDCSDD